jgi:cell division control protein 6
MTKICSDHTKLSFDYVPDVLPCRENQLKELEMLFYPTTVSRVSQNVHLYGPVGTGKTVTARRFCINFKTQCQNSKIPFEYIHINCRQKMNEHNVTHSIISYFKHDFPDRGFSVQEMIQILAQILNAHKMHLLVVLDEVDVLLRKKADIIYNLTRINEDGVSEGRISVILISQTNVISLLDTASLSTFKRSNIIRFEKYTGDELYLILHARALDCLVPGTYSPDLLRFIAEVASATGDARHAIELLENAVIRAEARGAHEILLEDVRDARSRECEIDMELLNNLDRQKKIVLLAVAHALKNRVEATTGEIERNYEMLCELYNEKKKGHTQFWKYVHELANLGLIHTKSVHTKGTTTLVSLRDFSSKQISEILEKMLQ